ncbi:11341_t:CDS:2 [Cetraspora pellucida]|uniref:11341_t:CDS:1 n=1 Tax=Cetraspora pellucida TaxID=1433469 RepID=A0ACA9JZ76_9GLOM|nr:11341_t:CDS:2 [Cetraspora pellucida]
MQIQIFGLILTLHRSLFSGILMKFEEFDSDCKPQVFHLLISIISLQEQLR